MNIERIKNRIAERLPEGLVIPRHTEKGHFYEVVPLHVIFPSVTGKLQIVKDDSLANYKMNRALEVVMSRWDEMTSMVKAMEIVDEASKASEVILQTAGDIGTEVHDARERYFKDWIKTGVRPEGRALSYLTAEAVDPRIRSCLRALDKFIDERNYVPLRTELFVYDKKWKVAGTLDDIGLMATKHKDVFELVLMDLKTSNQFKDTYFFQVALYYIMFYRLTGLRPKRAFILKLSKEDGTYKIEDLKFPGKLARMAEALMRTNDAVDYIKLLRKDNQKVVVKL